MAKTIDEIGYQSCILVTDYGQPHNETPIHALNRFIKELLIHGVSEEKIIRMVKDNPENLLSIC